MASKTTNYNLDMPAYNEIADIDVINGNMDKIDMQMKKNADSAKQSKDIVSDEYSATNTYAVGDYCIRENVLYKCNTAITTGEAFDSNKWIQTTCGTEFRELSSNLDGLEYSDVAGGANIWDEIWENGYINKENGENVNASIQIRSVNYISVKPSTTYTITCSSIVSKVLLFYDSSKNFIESKTTDWQKINTFITPNTCSYLRFYMPSQYGNIYKHDIAIIEGTSGEYLPYIPSVKMLADEVSAQNESLEDYGLNNKFNGLSQGYWNDSCVYTSSSADVCNASVYSCNAGDTVTVKTDVKSADGIYIKFFNSSNDLLQKTHTEQGLKEYTVTAPANATKFCYSINKSGITPTNAQNTRVYVNNAIDEIKNDLKIYTVEATQTSSSDYVDKLYQLPTGIDSSYSVIGSCNTVNADKNFSWLGAPMFTMQDGTLRLRFKASVGQTYSFRVMFVKYGGTLTSTT